MMIKNLYNSKRQTLSLIMVGLFALLAIGCGSSGDDVADSTATANVANGGGGGGAGSGILQFQFQTTPAQSTVPQGTTTLRFDFYSGIQPTSDTLVVSEVRAFAPEIAIALNPVVRSVVVTAFDAEDNRLTSFIGTFEIVVGETTTVPLQDLGPPTLTVTATPSSLQIGANAIEYTATLSAAGVNVTETVPESELTFTQISAPTGVELQPNGDILVPANRTGNVTIEVRVTGSETLVTNVVFNIPGNGIGGGVNL